MRQKAALNLVFLTTIFISVACGSVNSSASVSATLPAKQPTLIEVTEKLITGTETIKPTFEVPTTHLPEYIESPYPAAIPTTTLLPERGLHTIIAESGAIEASIPIAWTDMRSEPWLNIKNQPIGITFLASTNIEDFLDLKAEGVSISVTKMPETGYVQLFENESNFFKKICDDTYKTTWNVEHDVYKGKYVVLGCSYHPDSWLSVFSIVSKKEPQTYLVKVIGLDMVPTFGDEFRNIILQFKVHPENLP